MGGDRSETDPRVVRTRERVFEAVEMLLTNEDLDAVTHSRVAREADVGRATLYRHWPDLSALLVEAIGSIHQRRAARVSTPLAELSLRDAAHLLLATFAEQVDEDPLHRAMFGLLDRAQHDPVYAEVRATLALVGIGPLRAIVSAAMERGEVPADSDLGEVEGWFLGPIMHRRFMLAAPLDAGFIERHIDGWLRAIRWTMPG